VLPYRIGIAGLSYLVREFQFERDRVLIELNGFNASATEGIKEQLQGIREIVSFFGGSVAEWFACWTQAQKGPGSNHSRDAVG